MVLVDSEMDGLVAGFVVEVGLHEGNLERVVTVFVLQFDLKIGDEVNILIFECPGEPEHGLPPHYFEVHILLQRLLALFQLDVGLTDFACNRSI
jgi:hypothetical protein